MDKALILTLIGLFSAFITAVIGFTKLINDKESKVSEFRQEWTNTVRQAVSSLASSFRVFFDLYEKAHSISLRCESLNLELTNINNEAPENKAKIEALQHNKNMLERFTEEITEVRKSIHLNAALTLLHFKPVDSEFQHIEGKIDSVLKIISELTANMGIGSGRERANMIAAKKIEVEVFCRDIISLSRHVLKGEWERIKGGEENYKKTKKIFKLSSFSILAAIVFLFILLIISRYSHYLAEEIAKKPLDTTIKTTQTDMPFDEPQKYKSTLTEAAANEGIIEGEKNAVDSGAD